MDDGLFTALKRRWTLRFGPSTDGAVTPGDVVKWVGTVAPDEGSRVSPMFGRECVLYTVKGNRVEGAGRNRRVITIADEEWSAPFWLDSDAGRVRVEPEGWIKYLGPSRRVPNGPTAGANLDAFTERYGTHERAFFEGFGGGAAYYERSLDVGERVAVIGEVHEAGSVAGEGYRGSTMTYALRPPARGRLWVSDDPAHAR